MTELDYVIGPISALDAWYLDRSVWTRELSDEQFADGVVCQAFDEYDFEIGHLAIDGDGKILAVEVERDQSAQRHRDEDAPRAGRRRLRRRVLWRMTELGKLERDRHASRVI